MDKAKDLLDINLISIPHGHNKSFRTGIHDALEGANCDNVPNGHENSYRRGCAIGAQLRDEISSKEKP